MSAEDADLAVLLALSIWFLAVMGCMAWLNRGKR